MPFLRNRKCIFKILDDYILYNFIFISIFLKFLPLLTSFLSVKQFSIQYLLFFFPLLFLFFKMDQMEIYLNKIDFHLVLLIIINLVLVLIIIS